MRSVKTLIIGNGIAAKCVIYYLNKMGLKDIIQVSDEKEAPDCSTHSTAINCLRGTRPNLTPLGDRILASHKEFESFFNSEKPSGIEEGIEYQSWVHSEANNKKWLRRYKVFDLKEKVEHFNTPFNTALNCVANKAYIISPHIFLGWLDSQKACEQITDFVIDIQIQGNNKIVKMKSGEIYKTENLILCTNYITPKFSHLVKDETLKKQLEHSKPVPGTFIKFDLKDFNLSQFKTHESFVFAFEQMYFIYRKIDQSILFGATSTNNELNFDHNKEELLKLYRVFTLEFSHVFDLPVFEKGEMITGVRHKGQNRQPYWGEVNDGIYAVWGLYKNAYTFSFAAGKSISGLLCKKVTQS